MWYYTSVQYVQLNLYLMQGVHRISAVDTLFWASVWIPQADITMAALDRCIIFGQAVSWFNYTSHSNCVFILTFTLWYEHDGKVHLVSLLNLSPFPSSHSVNIPSFTLTASWVSEKEPITIFHFVFSLNSVYQCQKLGENQKKGTHADPSQFLSPCSISVALTCCYIFEEAMVENICRKQNYKK